MVRTPHFHGRGLGSIPGREDPASRAGQPSEIK